MIFIFMAWDGKYILVYTGALGRVDRTALSKREKALRYYVSGELVKAMKNPVFAEYDISENDEGSEYK